MRETPPSNPYNLALKWLALRELSGFQIRQRLQARQVPPQTIDDVIAKLETGGALDDRRTALASALVFLELNGFSVPDPQGELYEAMMAISARTLDKAGLSKNLLKSNL